MTDHDQQLPRVAHGNDGEAVGSRASDRNRRYASPLFELLGAACGPACGGFA